MTRDTDPSPDDPDAEAITDHAARRGLGNNPRLRTAARVGWSAFIGASLALLILLLMPEGWFDAPLSFGRLSLLFFGLWWIALVPALSAALLNAGAGGSADAR